MTDQGTRFALLGRSVCGAVGSPVSYRHSTDGPGWPPIAAGTDVLEGVAVQGVAADAAVFDTEAATYYGHGVEHTESVFLSALEKLPPPPGWTMGELRGEEGHLYLRGEGLYLRSATTDAEALQAEQVRLSRLSRWQEQR